jgi:MFS family permease
MTAFSLPLAAVPAQAAAAGHDPMASSLLATVFLAGIVAGELGAAAVIARIGTRAAIITGLVLLGVPSLIVAVSSDVGTWVACGAVRGVGFAFVVIAAAAIVAAGAGDDRLGAELGWYGVAAGLPSIVALPFGLQLGQAVGFWAVHLLAASAALGALGGAIALPGRPRREDARGATPDSAYVRGRDSDRAGIRTMLRSRRAIGLAAALAAGAATNGMFVVLVPLGGHGDGADVLALLVLAVGAPAGRVIAGRVGDRVGPAALIAPSLAMCGGGLAISASVGAHTVFVLGACAAGFGFGVLQNATLQALCSDRPVRELAAASALWNLAYDLGLAIGTVAFGLFAGILAPATGPAIVGAVLAASVVVAVIVVMVGGGRSGRGHATVLRRRGEIASVSGNAAETSGA